MRRFCSVGWCALGVLGCQDRSVPWGSSAVQDRSKHARPSSVAALTRGPCACHAPGAQNFLHRHPTIPALLCRNCRQIVGGGRDGRGCKRCNWYLDWDASWDEVRPYRDKESERDARVLEARSTEAEYVAWLNASLARVRGLVTQKPMTNAAVLRIKTVLDAQMAYNKYMQEQIAYNKYMQAQIAYNKQMQTAS